MDLWPHQQHSVERFSATQCGFDFSDPGTGKTRTHLAIYAARKQRKRCLIVSPKTLMTSAWAAEIREVCPYLSFSLATAEKRQEAFEQRTDIVIINTDGVVSALKNKKIAKILATEFDHLIIDESSAYKHRGSQRSKAMAKIAKNMLWRFLLSGTPNPNSVTELWHQAYIMDGGARLGDNFYKFQRATQVPTQVGPQPNHLRWDDREGVELEVFHLLNDVTVRHAFEDVMTHVPPNHRAYSTFTLPPKLQKMYIELEKTSQLELRNGLTAVHASALRNKLLQLCSGAVYDNEGEYTVLDRGRYELIADLVQERDHSVVFFNWKHQREELVNEFIARDMYFAVIDGDTSPKLRTEIVRDYQAGYYQTLLLHPRTGAHGLTLTRGTTTIMSSPIYEADMLKQAIHRIYRGAQDKVTNTLLVRAEGTVEEFVYERLNDKTLRMDDFLSLLTASINKRGESDVD